MVTGRYRPATAPSWPSVWPSRYPRSAVTAATSNTASATRMTSSTPASTRTRSWEKACSRRGPGMRRAACSARSRRLVAICVLLAPRRPGPGQAQAVADRALGVDQVRAVPGQLAPQVSDVGGDDRAGAAEVVVPDMVEQLGPGEHPAGVEHQVPQQPELRRGQLDQVACPADLVAFLVELDVGERQHRPGCGGGGGAAQHGAD